MPRKRNTPARVVPPLSSNGMIPAQMDQLGVSFTVLGGS